MLFSAPISPKSEPSILKRDKGVVRLVISRHLGGKERYAVTFLSCVLFAGSNPASWLKMGFGIYGNAMYFLTP